MFQGHTEIAKKLINAGCKINELIYVINSKMFNDAIIFCILECLDGGLLRPHSLDNHEGEQGNIQCRKYSMTSLTITSEMLLAFAGEKV